MEVSRARFGADGALGSLRIDFDAFWRSPGLDFEVMGIYGHLGPGPDLEVSQGKTRHGMAWRGTVRYGKARQSMTMQGEARQGTTRQCKSRQGNAIDLEFIVPREVQ